MKEGFDPLGTAILKYKNLIYSNIMYEKFGQFINGKWSKSSGGETYEVFNPANEELLGKAQKQIKILN